MISTQLVPLAVDKKKWQHKLATLPDKSTTIGRELLRKLRVYRHGSSLDFFHNICVVLPLRSLTWTKS